MEPQNGFKNIRKSDKKRNWNEVNKTCWKTAKIASLDLQETRFRMDALATNTKTKREEKYKNTKNVSRNESKIHEKSFP